MRECATLFCKTKIDPYLYLERFIEVNKSFFVENAQVKFATLLLEADAAGGRDWNTWARDWGSWMKGGQGEMEKSRADVSYIYGQAMQHLNQLMGLISNNPEADDPKILNSLRMQLQNVSKTLTSIKPSIDTLAPKIMNVAFNKYKGINTPLAPSGDMASLKAVRDGKILQTIADMIMKLNNPATNDADKGSIQTTLNSIKTRQLDFQDYSDLVGRQDLQRVISWKANYWTTLSSDQQAALVKFFGDEKQAKLAFAKFKYFRGLTPARDVMVQANPKVKNQLDEMEIFAKNFESWMAGNQKQIIRKVIPGGMHTWKQREEFFVKLQQDNEPFARILQQKNLLSPIIQLYTTMANWFERNPTTGATQYDSLFGAAAMVRNREPKIKKQIAAVIAGIYQKTVGNNAAFDQLKTAHP
jgi:hypothetical protein